MAVNPDTPPVTSFFYAYSSRVLLYCRIPVRSVSSAEPTSDDQSQLHAHQSRAPLPEHHSACILLHGSGRCPMPASPLLPVHSGSCQLLQSLTAHQGRCVGHSLPRAELPEATRLPSKVKKLASHATRGQAPARTNRTAGTSPPEQVSLSEILSVVNLSPLSPLPQEDRKAK